MSDPQENGNHEWQSFIPKNYFYVQAFHSLFIKAA